MSLQPPKQSITPVASGVPSSTLQAWSWRTEVARFWFYAYHYFVHVFIATNNTLFKCIDMISPSYEQSSVTLKKCLFYDIFPYYEIHLFKLYNQGFLVESALCNHEHNLILQHCNHSPKKSCTHKQVLLVPSQSSQPYTSLVYILWDLLFTHQCASEIYTFWCK